MNSTDTITLSLEDAVNAIDFVKGVTYKLLRPISVGNIDRNYVRPILTGAYYICDCEILDDDLNSCIEVPLPVEKENLGEPIFD